MNTRIERWEMPDKSEAGRRRAPPSGSRRLLSRDGNARAEHPSRVTAESPQTRAAGHETGALDTGSGRSRMTETA